MATGGRCHGQVLFLVFPAHHAGGDTSNDGVHTALPRTNAEYVKLGTTRIVLY